MERLIFDCDNTMGLPRREIDDGLTLYYLLGRPDVELLGVTTTFGNGPLEDVTKQTRYMLSQAGRPDLPVLRGESREQADNPDSRHPTEAARFLVEQAAASPGQITILATGPLGNLGAAATLAPGFFGNIKQIVCMGGYVDSLRIGWRRLDELNLSGNPQASHIVLTQNDCPLTVMNAQICLQAPFTWRDLARLQGWKYRVHTITRNWLLVFGLYCGVSYFYLWDLVPAVYITHPDLFDRQEIAIHSTLADLETGMLVVSDPTPETRVNMPSRILDRDRFNSTLFNTWQTCLAT